MKHRRGRQSQNGRRVAENVREQILTGKLINLAEAQRKAGYKEASVRSMKGTRNRAYQEAKASIVDQIAAIRADMLLALAEKDMTKEKATTIIEGIDKLTKNHQLLTGEATENTEFKIVEG